jgi:hypothetical protein
MYWHSIWYQHHYILRQENIRIIGDIDVWDRICIIYQHPWIFTAPVLQKIRIFIPLFSKYTYILHHCAYSLKVNLEVK